MTERIEADRRDGFAAAGEREFEIDCGYDIYITFSVRMSADESEVVESAVCVIGPSRKLGPEDRIVLAALEYWLDSGDANEALLDYARSEMRWDRG